MTDFDLAAWWIMRRWGCYPLIPLTFALSVAKWIKKHRVR
jgi:hypothetical protein